MPFGISWKTIGIICGACAAPLTGGASLSACIACGGAGLVAGHVLDNSEKKDKIKKERLDLKGKTVETIIADNNQAQQESDEWKKKYDELDERIKKRDEEIRKVTDKLKDPKLPQKEREELEEKLAILISNQDEDKREKNNILDKIKKLGERIKSNNKTISNDSSSNSNEKNWIWDLITLENILLGAGCYILYKLLKDDKK